MLCVQQEEGRFRPPCLAPCPLVSTTLGLRLSGPWGRVTGPNAQIGLHCCHPRSQAKSGTITDMGSRALGAWRAGGPERCPFVLESHSSEQVSLWLIPVQADPHD